MTIGAAEGEPAHRGDAEATIPHFGDSDVTMDMYDAGLQSGQLDESLQIPDSEDHPNQGTSTAEETNTQPTQEGLPASGPQPKRRRVFMDAVVVPSLASVTRKRQGGALHFITIEDEDENEEIYKKLAKLVNVSSMLVQM